jgi:diphthine synthase
MFIKIVYGTLSELLTVDFGPPLHCLALCGDLHPLELEVSSSYDI